jgi:hypothetical protein
MTRPRGTLSLDDPQRLDAVAHRPPIDRLWQEISGLRRCSLSANASRTIT